MHTSTEVSILLIEICKEVNAYVFILHFGMKKKNLDTA